MSRIKFYMSLNLLGQMPPGLNVTRVILKSLLLAMLEKRSLEL